jgi:2-oxo-4-hydroxy-4-carboxy-5-ureidoimidazoline decarboxylase
MAPWQRVDLASPDEARSLLCNCCGSTRWVDAMLARRPFGGEDALMTAARDIWAAASVDDWKEAFSHHPKIGDRNLREKFAATRHLAEKEQAGVAGAAADVLDALAEANRAYEARFGYIFIVCATGKTAAEMLALVGARLGNDPAMEILVAAAEQARITAIRLEGLARPTPDTRSASAPRSSDG